MARPQATDFFHNMRFHVTAGTGFLDGASAGQPPQAGFSTCSTPSASVAVAEYREGHYVYTRKQPGIPAMEDIAMNRGVTRKDTEFWKWLQLCIEGGEYRTDLQIKHFTREALPGVPPAPTGTNSAQSLDVGSPFRVYVVQEAFAMSHKVATDLDASSSEISISDLGISYEAFDIIIN